VNELFLEKSNGEVRIAHLSNKLLVDYIREGADSSFRVGDIYLGRVKKVIPGLNAAFVDIGYEKDAFLHYHDLGPNFLSFFKFAKLAHQGIWKENNLNGFKLENTIEKTGSVEKIIKPNNIFPVQVFKEPIHNKGPRVTCDISFAGRFLVLVPFSNHVSVSRKIGNPEQKRLLKQLANTLRPENFGLIIRTVAENATEEDFKKDLNDVLSRFYNVVNNIKSASPRKKLTGETSATEIYLRDILNDTFENIWVSDQGLFEEVKAIVAKITQNKAGLVKLHKAKDPLFVHHDIDKQIKAAFGKRVAFSAGSYLIIEHTEALHVIDVNSGRQLDSGDDQQTIALQVNLEAAKEIARQLKLRDMGGIIVIDFIDLKSAPYRKELENMLRDLMKSDKAKHTILPMTKFGLIQITRERIKPETVIITSEICPACNGSGRAESSMLLEDRLIENLVHLWQNQNMKKLTMVVNPILKSYIVNGRPSLRVKWFLKYKRWVRIKEDRQMPLGLFSFENEHGEEVVV
jgi:ribonuclease G